MPQEIQLQGFEFYLLFVAVILIKLMMLINSSLQGAKPNVFLPIFTAFYILTNYTPYEFVLCGLFLLSIVGMGLWKRFVPEFMAITEATT